MKRKIALSAIMIAIGLANNISACEKLNLSEQNKIFEDKEFKKTIATKTHILESDCKNILEYIKTHQKNIQELQVWLRSSGILKKFSPTLQTTPTRLPNQQRLLVLLSLLLPIDVNEKLTKLQTTNVAKKNFTENFVRNLTNLSTETLTKSYPPRCKWLYQCARCAELIKAATEEAGNLKK